MAFLYLLLGHLIGDFVFQTDRIAKNKNRFREWNFLHVIIVTACILISAISFGLLTVILVLLNGALHYILDFSKPVIARVLHLTETAGFILDQAVHILLLYAISLTAVQNSSLIMLNPSIVKFLTGIALATYFSSILNQFILNAAFPGSRSAFFGIGEKYTGILVRLLMALSLYLAYTVSPFFLLMLSFAAAAEIVQFRLKWKAWMNLKQLSLKLFLDTALSLAAAAFIILV